MITKNISEAICFRLSEIETQNVQKKVAIISAIESIFNRKNRTMMSPIVKIQQRLNIFLRKSRCSYTKHGIFMFDRAAEILLMNERNETETRNYGRNITTRFCLFVIFLIELISGSNRLWLSAAVLFSCFQKIKFITTVWRKSKHMNSDSPTSFSSLLFFYLYIRL